MKMIVWFYGYELLSWKVGEGRQRVNFKQLFNLGEVTARMHDVLNNGSNTHSDLPLYWTPAQLHDMLKNWQLNMRFSINKFNTCFKAIMVFRIPLVD
jgi:Ser/Thr protein kinase RdoA (MazF antagonist)